MIIVLIINIILSNSKNENFDVEPNKLIYLYDTDSKCPNCKNFKEIWNNIKKEVNKEYLYYNFITEEYNIDTDKEGKEIAKINKINTPPEIVFKTNDIYTIYSNKSKEVKNILDWAQQISVP